ncbi:MAG: hypothetical protein LBT05_11285 [Planctomycetaceae bacterium]|jgi:dihydroorotate dehydrogenase/Pyruvate/2-oxoacid:ferredoxin oxidoreductase delta subunit|nr:hypothetical protein [Planctomycetaceae bacterium]
MKANFLGYTLNGNIIAASCPATENAEKVRQCEKHGASAVILKTATGTDGGVLGENDKRRCYFDKRGFWAKSTFPREIMPLNESVEILRTVNVKIPIIASITETELAPEKWLADCVALENAGANAIQLDLFYLENLLSLPDFALQFTNLINEIVRHSKIPIMPKLNLGLPAEYAVYLLKQTDIHYVSLLDSVHSPAPLIFHIDKVTVNPDFLGTGLSVFGNFMFPLTRNYTKIISDAGFEVCAGGGIKTVSDIAELLFLGAASVQVATDVLLNGFQRFSELQNELDTLLANLRITDVAELCRQASILYPVAPPKIAQKYACVDGARCLNCGRCIRQTFCEHIYRNGEKITISDCEGCGLCANLCKLDAIIESER